MPFLIFAVIGCISCSQGLSPLYWISAITSTGSVGELRSIANYLTEYEVVALRTVSLIADREAELPKPLPLAPAAQSWRRYTEIIATPGHGP
jgi:hypothetical protein